MRAPGCTLLLLIAHFTVISCDYVLIPMGSQWSFDDTGADRITQQYQSVTYDASSWQTGNGILGYGYTGISTTISFGSDVMAKIIRFGIARCWLFGLVCTCSSRTAEFGFLCSSSYYYRKEVMVFDKPSTLGSVMISVQAVHGVRCFFNGIEVYRKNMPLGPLTSLSTASNSITKPTMASAYIQTTLLQRLVTVRSFPFESVVVVDPFIASDRSDSINTITSA